MDGRKLVYGSIFCLVYIVVWVTGTQTECTEGKSSFQQQSSILIPVNKTRQVKTKRIVEPKWYNILCYVPGIHCTEKIVTKYKIETYQDVRKETKNVTKCCPGYVQNDNTTCVKGCNQGTYGENCTLNCSCPENAFGNCDIETGKCTCKQGWTGSNCAEQCDEGYYGQNCEEQCFCENNSTCNIYTGSCNCSSPGWYGAMCEKECEDGKFGTYCDGNCTCHVNQSCDRINGECTCKPGRTGTYCQDECTQGFFGKDCNSSCSCNETTTEICDITSGECECKAGYSGRNCNYVCPPGTYGKDCVHECFRNCNYTEYCDPFTGQCLCIGKTGANCSEDCDEGKFGINCSDSCSCTESEICDSIFGNCSCKPGHICQTVTDIDPKQNATIGLRKTESTDSIGKMPIIVSACVGGAIILGVVIVLVCRFKRNGRQQDSVKRDTTRNNGNNGENKNPNAGMELQRVNGTDYCNVSSGNVERRGEDTNDLNEETDGNNGVKDRGSEINFHDDENAYDETNKKPVTQSPDEYNTCRDVKQYLSNNNGDFPTDNVYNVLHEIDKPKHVSQEGYWTFQQVRDLELDGSEQDTYNVLNGERKSDRGQFQAYGYASATDFKTARKEDGNKSFDTTLAQSSVHVNDCVPGQAAGGKGLNKDNQDENVSEDHLVEDSTASQMYENVQTGTGENGDPPESIYE